MTPEERAKILEEARPYWMAHCAGLVSEARNQALEEAAMVVKNLAPKSSPLISWAKADAAILALKDEGADPWADENQRIYDEKEERISGDDKIAGDRIRDARNEALEEAAKLCEDHGHSNGSIRGSHKHLAAAIRALKDK